uniref:Uncharacterized protein n=2 Tax=Oryza sativa subsp. japonica TaxID=39947 RepID=Q2QZB2_ORYSJ|nr:hypothetical protein LOC_Os11g47090 [Oryza sativa Japonica Group]ABA95452.1 hypothetical protein LOC_Os11g47089 [Oryza sativa Japonica Group]
MESKNQEVVQLQTEVVRIIRKMNVTPQSKGATPAPCRSMSLGT